MHDLPDPPMPDLGLADPVLDGLIERFDHVAVAVWDVDASASLARLMGGELLERSDHPTKRFRITQWRLPGRGKLEMLQPLDPEDESHFLVKFLRARGEGLHHLTFKVRDLAEAARRAEELGFTLTGWDDSNPSWREVFVHPKSAHGVLVQFAQWDD